MARIKQLTLSPDLFGDKANKAIGVSLPDISWADYAEIVGLAAKKYDRPLRRLTPKFMRESAAKFPVSLVIRKPLGTAGEIARPYHSALLKQETNWPKLIYGVKDAMDEIPFE